LNAWSVVKIRVLFGCVLLVARCEFGLVRLLGGGCFRVDWGFVAEELASELKLSLTGIHSFLNLNKELITQLYLQKMI